MTVSRRNFVNTSLMTACLPLLPRSAFSMSSIKFGSILDQSGPFSAYGDPMAKAEALAIKKINDSGGLNGDMIEVVSYDTQSDMALYTQYGQQLSRRDKVDVVHGGILSASREALRPTLRKHDILYFYNVLYEGGVCDRNIFITGITPAQQVEVLIPEAVKRFGKKAYILAADYNYGQITAAWVQKYLRDNGATDVEVDFFSLDISDFNATINKIQSVNPDFVVSVLVGGAHLSFYRQWASAGMKSRIPMVSTTLGVGNEHLVLTPEEGDGILVAYNYARNNQNQANQEFIDSWDKTYGAGSSVSAHEIAVSHYQGIQIWAEAVRRAGTTQRDAVIQALETGLSIEGPSGTVTIDPATHHAILDVHLMEVKNQQLNVLQSYSAQPPIDTQTVCDLKRNPDDNQQYEITVSR